MQCAFADCCLYRAPLPSGTAHRSESTIARSVAGDDTTKNANLNARMTEVGSEGAVGTGTRVLEVAMESIVRREREHSQEQIARVS